VCDRSDEYLGVNEKRPRAAANGIKCGGMSVHLPNQIRAFQGAFSMNESRQSSFNSSIFFAKMVSGITKVTFPKDQALFAQGEPADSVFYLEKGKVKVTVLSTRGKEGVVALLDAGNFCGEGCLAGQPVRMASATAMIDCGVIRIDKEAMVRLIRDEPAIAEMFVTHLLARNVRVESDLVDQLFNSSEKRLARLLLILANFGKEGKSEPTLPPINQETLAEMIGTTRSRVSFFMNKFRQLGLINYNGHLLEVHGSLLSVVLSDQPTIED
jgi:CRP/FNR family transcriptional regulator, cyclic AMP receptor protein